MPKRTKDDAQTPPKRVVSYKVDERLWQRIEATAKTLGLDNANFARMVMRENLATYEQRAAQIDDKEQD